MAGLLVCSNFGSPLRADDEPLVITASGGSQHAATVGDHAPGVQFREKDSDSKAKRSRKGSLTLGNHPSASPRAREAQVTGQKSEPSGFRFAGDEAARPAASSGRMSSTSQDRSAPTPQFRFNDQRPPLVRRPSGAGLLTLTLNRGKAPSENGGSAAPAQGFAFTDSVEPLILTDDATSGIEPTLARDLLTIGTPATSPALQKTAAVPQVPAADNSAHDPGGVLMTIRQRSAATSSSHHPLPARMPASNDSAGAPLPPQQTPPAVVPSATTASGVVNVSAFEPDANSESLPVTTAEGHRPVAKVESHVASAEVAPTLQRLSAVETIGETQNNHADMSPPAWAQPRDAGPPARNVEQAASEGKVPASPETPADQEWWTAAEEQTGTAQTAEDDFFAANGASDLSAPLELAAAHLLLPVTVMSFEMAPQNESDHSTPAAAAPHEPPALLDAQTNDLLHAPLTRTVETPYSGATKPVGAATVPHSGTYTMGPARASHPLPHAQPAINAGLPGQPYQTSDAEVSPTSPAIEVAALLQDLDPLVPGPSRPSANPTSPTAADFPPSDPGPIDTPAADQAAGGGASAAEQTLGEAPEETNEPLQFLRRQTVLLEPGEHQFDIGISYLNNTSDFPTLLSEGEDLAVVRAQTRQRLLSVPMELRIGVAPYTQAFVNVPFGWSNSEVSFNGSEFTEDEGGIGDVSAGITKQIILGNEYYPDVLASLAFSAPTGDSSITTALETPGSSLGQGFWTLTGSLSFIQTYDPLVFFYGLGYTFRFQNEFGDNIEVEPGDQVFYRFGAGFAVNPHVTLSAAFTGSVIGRDKVDGDEIGGSVREPMSLRLAATISRRKGSKTHSSFKLVEPFVNFGLNDDSIDTLVGVSWTH